MLHNDWVASSPGGADVTGNRPTKPVLRQEFHDTTLNLIIVWDGKNWRNHTTGSIA